MPKLIASATVLLCLGTAAVAATPKNLPAATQPAVSQQPVKPQQLRVAPYTKTNLKDCVPTTAPVQRDAVLCT